MKSLILLIVAVLYSTIFAQHLPLQIQNQWHYNAFPLPGMNYAAIAVDTIMIADKIYFEIERRHYNTGELLEITYDRLQGDSAYYRIRNGNESLIINFNWPDGYTQVVQTDSCYDITIMNRWFTNFWGSSTEMFSFTFGFWCEGMEDTAWVLTSFLTTRMFGCYLGYDGYLTGAVINGTTYGTLHPLPVELLSFTASVNGKSVILNWQTATEINNSGFEVQRLGNQEREWEKIGFMNGYGTSTEKIFYSYEDMNLSSGKYQYRLKQIDFDGTFEYSNIIEADVLIPGEFILNQNYPNPFNPVTIISWQQPVQSKIIIKVFDVLGTEIKTIVNGEFEAGNNEVELDASGLSAGIYFYSLQSGNFLKSKKFTLLK